MFNMSQGMKCIPDSSRMSKLFTITVESGSHCS